MALFRFLSPAPLLQARPPSILHGSSTSPSPLGVSSGDDGVSFEGVIQFEKPDAPEKLVSWVQVGLLAGGDVLMSRPCRLPILPLAGGY
ncbi:hypothetical protein COCNU_05G000140 [Cocos nucifera]|uniref:Uncharacterized protein n=1 Tax=Cocos nucifera TaxID=13894 RepID=A0A8K0N112_COCNU|nr:hypothetical protein COCNU_05G000140 [Cocos nucifera]